jgi:hypothetical protein
MTQVLNRTCRLFRKEANSQSSDDDSDSGEEDIFLKELEKAKNQKTKEASGQSDYINCDFVAGSAAVAKSLWSVFDAFNKRGTVVCL